jgi:hypothetical protein
MKKYSVLVKRFTEEYCRVEVETTETDEAKIKDQAIERAFDQANWSLAGTDDVETTIEEVTDDEDR